MDEFLNREKRLLVFGYFGGRNFGDEMMLLGLLEAARRNEVGEVRIVTPDAQLPTHLQGKVAGSFPKSARGFADGLRWATAFAFCGGTVFHDGFCEKRHRQYRMTLAGFAGLCLAAHLAGRRVYMMGIGMGPFRRTSTKLLARIAATAARKITLRDRRSLDDAIAVGIDRGKARKVRDLALNVPVKPREKGAASPLLVLSLVSPTLTDTADAGAATAFATGMAAAINQFLTANPDWRAALLAVAVGKRDNDLEFTKEFHSRLEPTAQRVVRIEFDGNPETFLDYLSRASAVIASRYHVAVIAENMSVPTLWVPYQRKVLDGADDASVPGGRIFAPQPSSLPGIAAWLNEQSRLA